MRLLTLVTGSDHGRSLAVWERRVSVLAVDHGVKGKIG